MDNEESDTEKHAPGAQASSLAVELRGEIMSDLTSSLFFQENERKYNRVKRIYIYM